ncbi:hypothetical protein Busp01_01520 [Trinickia caryophylli]|nr:hypothetical protein Busp01_01520 [Trinickia caryophylli]
MAGATADALSRVSLDARAAACAAGEPGAADDDPPRTSDDAAVAGAEAWGAGEAGEAGMWNESLEENSDESEPGCPAFGGVFSLMTIG